MLNNVLEKLDPFVELLFHKCVFFNALVIRTAIFEAMFNYKLTVKQIGNCLLLSSAHGSKSRRYLTDNWDFSFTLIHFHGYI